MNTQSKICVNSLPAKEAWILFNRVVGERLENDANLKPVAEEVAKECSGLPLLIQAVGNALKYESIDSWKTALSRLRKPAASDIDPDIEKTFTRLQLSYEYLKSEEAKSCFLLCSLLAEDNDISLEDLVYYMVGLHKVDDLESIEDARDRVRNAANMLTSSCLLLNVGDEGFTEMHDVVRDIALLISFEGKNKYLVKAGKSLREWQPGNKSLESYTGISLMNNWISKLPDYEVHLSSLDIFLVNNNDVRMISDEFIKGMKEVKVLDLSKCRMTQLSQSFEVLTKLRLLNLTGNNSIHEISILGEMKKLEILILNDTGIKEIPNEIGRLVNLRRLSVSKCRYLTHVTPGVISKLHSLEEFCIDLSEMSEGVNACTAEVMKLAKLTYLDLKVKCFEFISEGGFNSENLKGFMIQIGDFNGGYDFRRSDRYLIISSKHLRIPFLKWLKKLLEVSRPCISLSRIENLNNIMPTLCDEGFSKLKHIELSWCPNVSCLVDDSKRCDGDEGKTEEKYFKELKQLGLVYLHDLEVLWKCPDENISLTNLVTLSIESCSKLERVFTMRAAQGLVNLKYLSIEVCDGLEEVIYGDDESGNVIVFPSLTTISLYLLSRLKRFFNSAGNCSIKYPSLVEVGFGSMGTWNP